MEVCDNTKMKSGDSRNGAVYIPATFMHTGGMSHIHETTTIYSYVEHIVTTFRHATPNMALQLNPDYNELCNTSNDYDNCERQSRLLDQEHATVVSRYRPWIIGLEVFLC